MCRMKRNDFVPFFFLFKIEFHHDEMSKQCFHKSQLRCTTTYLFLKMRAAKQNLYHVISYIASSMQFQKLSSLPLCSWCSQRKWNILCDNNSPLEFSFLKGKGIKADRPQKRKNEVKKKEKENKNEKEEIVVVRCTQNDVVGCRQKVEKEVEVVPWVVRSSAFSPGKFSLVSGSGHLSQHLRLKLPLKATIGIFKCMNLSEYLQ